MNLLRAIMPGLVVLLALGSGAPGQGDAPATATGTPKVVFAQPVHNFGELKPNAEVTHEFAFTNAGGATLEIIRVQSTCGCTAVTPSKKLLAPGESSVIKVTYHAGRTAGMSEKKIMVFSNDPEQPESVLTIRAAIKTDLEFNPSYIRFDNILIDQAAEASVFFMAKNPDAFKLTDLKADDPFLRCDWRRTDDGRFELKVAFVPEQVKADHRGYLNSTVRAKTNSESFPVIQLPVYIKFQEEFAVVPTRLMMYGLKAGTEATRDVIVKSNKGVAFQITAAESSNPFVRAEVVRNGEVANVVKIVIDAKAPAGLCNATVTVRMGARHLAVPVRARIGDAVATPAPAGPTGGR